MRHLKNITGRGGKKLKLKPERGEESSIILKKIGEYIARLPCHIKEHLGVGWGREQDKKRNGRSEELNSSDER